MSIIVPTAELRRIEKMKAQRSMSRAAREAREFSEQVADGRASYAGMLSRLWAEANRTLSMVETASEAQLPLLKRTAALRDVGKLLPQLAKAEANQIARIGKKAVEDLSERELAKLARRELRRVSVAKDVSDVSNS